MTEAVIQEEVKSTHKVEVVPFAMRKHPNADSLSIVDVYGYTCVVRTEDWQGITLAAYIPPDSTVDTKRPEFAFLAKDAKADGRARVKAKKLRGVLSFGCLIPAPPDTQPGDDIAVQLDVQHYEPAVAIADNTCQRMYLGGEVASAPDVYSVKYDVDAFRRYHTAFKPGETIIIFEKLDGTSAKYVYSDGKMHVSSRNEWKKEYPDYSHVTAEHLIKNGVPEDKVEEILDKLHNKPKRKNIYWEILEQTPNLEKFCQDNPGHIVHGEIFGGVGRIKYGVPNQLAAFDIMYAGRWMNKTESESRLLSADVPFVPFVSCLLYDFDKVCLLAEGNTYVPDATKGCIREGIVISPIEERWCPEVGRCQLKCVSAAYLDKY